MTKRYGWTKDVLINNIASGFNADFDLLPRQQIRMTTRDRPGYGAAPPLSVQIT
jgi:hypothetical protein